MNTRSTTKPEHTQRAFSMAAEALATTADADKLLASLDVLEVRLTDYADRVTRFTTPWGSQADDWLPAFRAAHAELAKVGGGRLIVPAGSYTVSACALMDLPSVSVHLQEGSELMKVGAPDEYLGCPLGFFGGLSDGEPRRQQNFAAVIGPGKIGYPQQQLDRYNRENGIGFSYIKTVHVEHVTVPFAPRIALTVQYGCNQVTLRRNNLGYSGQPADEVTRGGQAAIEVSGGFLDNKGHTNNGVPYPPRTTTVMIEGNTIAGGSRGIYVEWCGDVTVAGNDVGPMGRAGMVLAQCASAAVTGNTFRQVSRGAFGGFDALQFHSIPGRISVTRNSVLERTHNHCVTSTGEGASVIYARDNTWTPGHGSIFAGSPPWNSD